MGLRKVTKLSVPVGIICLLTVFSCNMSGKGDSEPVPDPNQGLTMNFDATDGSPLDCVFQFTDTGGATGDRTINAIQLDVPDGEGPPNSMEISYGFFSTGVFSLFPPPANVTLTEEPNDDSWHLVWGEMESDMTAGDTWSIDFSCGPIPSCCDDTSLVTVTLLEFGD